MYARFSGVPGKWLVPLAETAIGCSPQNELEYGKIMNRQVGDDADIPLEETQIYPRGVVVVELPKLAAPNDLGDLLDGARVDERMIDEQNLAAFLWPRRPT